ncbi:Putative short-chain dehydrogenase/reductase SDR, NAD(P)-binding domain superfamily [Colletotrichum destructivum]|uniref:Short-chain dehydrogenase/reductase SDR, NAD(P)-binding domain superfamily n=1 Tax=Colletotrichum destructivum TaxID=34406 RepID=A0AAX4ILB9_9PEZI|nr:Putative short-chain dehydrogenase/reductase SDR, NAD(P)-binding domain superfamily [Colletotrichum destructivum]
MDSVPVALITAGSAGLGAAAARVFVKNGFKVAINYSNNVERAGKLVEELKRSTDSDVLAIKADLGNRDDISKLVDETVAKMGRLDVVFSNGGWTHFRDMTNLDENLVEDDWDRCFNMNVKSHLWIMHAAKKHLDKTEGAFITTASIAGVSVSGSSLAYSVTKAAQIHLAKALAAIAAPRIRVNTVSPGLLLTDWAEKFSDEGKAAHIQKTVIKRAVTVEDVAEQVYTFAKSRSITGVNVVIDGGYTL